VRNSPLVLTESKSRMVSFRLTADEYDRFRELCSTCGTRSVSELARAAINSLLKQPAQVPREALESRVRELEGRVNMLRLEFRKLRQAGSSQVLDEAAASVVEAADKLPRRGASATSSVAIASAADEP
jgi:hypothetical protein